MSTTGKTPLRWAGSKRKILPQLLALAPREMARYIEPFCGSLSLFSMLKPNLAVVGDINQDLINFYQVLRRRPRAIAELAHSFDLEESTYYTLREQLRNPLKKLHRAAIFLYLNRLCFNGVYRTNRQGHFNVARGQQMGGIPTVEELVSFSHLLKSAEARQCDFESLVNEAADGDFVYLDPPYAGRNVRDRGEYGANAFKECDIARMFDAVSRASSRKANILISYADLPEIRARFSRWDLETISVSRNVSGFSKGRKVVDELIIRNYR